MNTFKLSRDFFDFSFENTGKIKPIHSAIYFFAIETCNRLGWKKEFGFPTSYTMEAIGVRSYNTYKSALDDLVEFGFIKMIKRSTNQHTANVIALSNYDKALDKALDKAMSLHETKQSESTLQSNDSIDKPYNLITLEPKNLRTDSDPSFLDRGKTAKAMKQSICFESKEAMLSEISKTEYADYLVGASAKWRGMSDKAQDLFLEEFAGRNANLEEYGGIKETYQKGLKRHLIGALKYHEAPKEKTASTYAYYYKIGNKEKKHNDKAMWERDKRNFGNGQGYSEIQVQEA